MSRSTWTGCGRRWRTWSRVRAGHLKLPSFGERRDRQTFADACGDPTSGASAPSRGSGLGPVCRGPVKYQGQQDVRRDIADMKAALADIVDVMLEVHAGAYSFEAASVRHEHEWKVWRDAKLPAGKVIAPGVVSHSTNVVEHPELVADRITRFADAVGRENVIASTDCGLGGRVHPQIAWAKLDTLVKGAELATRQLWR